MFSWKEKLLNFKTLSNNKYKQLNLKNLIYYINYTLFENNHIILRRFETNTYKSHLLFSFFTLKKNCQMCEYVTSTYKISG